ncbi:M48 family metallopeptidase [Fervidobacterium sp. 2310opik-2]|uniref:M48 family metallopeptidase n=1 Tax=Fervidobacterium sp. 2310opik-2 TaxID=1755815 RepID=UPI0013DE8123|nr:M48 family metallopeptidase [Fervidobacterium sp. 2310opik-2]KAF2962321.1 peptidase [Fervidobacterium sp. 2310opik-2]
MFIKVLILLVIFKEIWEVVLSLANLKYSLNTKNVPDILSDIMSAENFEKAKRYLKDRTMFSAVSTLVNLIVTLVFLLKGYPFLEKIVSNLTANVYLQALLFAGIYGLIDFLIDLPFKLFSTFVIEQKYGFNTTTLKTFIFDSLLSIVLIVTIATPILIGSMWFLTHFTIWWWQLSILVFLFLLFFSYIQPILIAPLFYKFTELKDGELKEKLKKLLTKSGVKVPNIYVMNASKRTKKQNAYLTGIGKARRLVLYDNILKQTDDEILAVVAHELGHHAHRHIAKLIAISSISTTLVLLFSNFVYLYLFQIQPFGISKPYTVIFYTFTFISALIYFVEPLLNYLQRKMEYEADEYSAKVSENPEYIISALKKLVKENLSNPNPLPLYKIWYYSHPAPEERIKHLLNLK